MPREFIEKYRGRYDIGWDAVRATRLGRQHKLGIVPAGTGLAPLNPGVTPWGDLAPDVRRLCARLQETYAAFLEHTDSQIGRLIEYLDSLGNLEDTLIVLLSDNGASPEGGPTGAFKLRKHMVYEEEAPEVGLSRLDDIGGDLAFNHYPTGWAQASNTPLKWYKKDTHGGGIRAPLIIHWPQRISARNAIRAQFHHVIDIAPTLYELVGVEAPTQYRGAPQIPLLTRRPERTWGYSPTTPCVERCDCPKMQPSGAANEIAPGIPAGCSARRDNSGWHGSPLWEARRYRW